MSGPGGAGADQAAEIRRTALSEALRLVALFKTTGENFSDEEYVSAVIADNLENAARARAIWGTL